MAKKPRIAVVGAGNLGSALARSLRHAGYKISEIISRDRRESRARANALADIVGAKAATLRSAAFPVEVVWICVSDREIASCARALARRTKWEGKIVFHSSGALTSDELRGLRGRGARVASLHPLMTFVPGISPSLKGVPFAVEGDAAAVKGGRRIAADLGGTAFSISKKNKAAYHAWGSFASPLLLSALVTAESVAQSAGVGRSSARKKMLPIILQTLANYCKRGPEGAFSGPIIRGDVSTVQSHLRTLKRNPEAKKVYIALARSALRFLPAKNRVALKKAIEELE